MIRRYSTGSLIEDVGSNFKLAGIYSEDLKAPQADCYIVKVGDEVQYQPA